MIKGITVSNGKTRLILIPENDLDKEVLKLLDGGVCKIIQENLKVYDQTVSTGLVIEAPTKDVPLREPTK